MSAEQRLKNLGIQLPEAPKPVGDYVAAVRTGNLVFTAGQLPLLHGKLLVTGKVPTAVEVEDAQYAARQAAINALAAVVGEVGSVDAIKRIVRLNCYVNSAKGFTQQASVADGASEILGAIFDGAGRHSRCAIGVAELPLNAPVELDLVVEVE